MDHLSILPTLVLERICLFLPIRETSDLRQLCRSLKGKLVSLPLARRQLRLFVRREYALNKSVAWGKILGMWGFDCQRLRQRMQGFGMKVCWSSVHDRVVWIQLRKFLFRAKWELASVRSVFRSFRPCMSILPHGHVSSQSPPSPSLDYTATPTSSSMLSPTLSTSSSSSFLTSYLQQSSTHSSFSPTPRMPRKHLNAAHIILSAVGNAPLLHHLLHTFPETDPTYCADLSIRAASLFNHLDVTRVLLSHHINTSAYDDEALRMAVHNGNAEIVRVFLECGYGERGARDDEALRVAAGNGDIEIVRMLLDHGYVLDPASRNNEALRQASKNGHADIVTLLLQTNKVDPTANFNEPLRAAVLGGRKRVVEVLMGTGKCQLMLSPKARRFLKGRGESRGRNREMLKVLLESGVAQRRNLVGSQRL
ncbi:ankyrin repeat-containing domain protein [Chytridium lagenaria]|nr:ankyrin repeat-containing domain protein [Chytridium lagenaria]